MYLDKSFRMAEALRENTFISGKIRVQFLTERLVRFEWQENAGFEDRQTLAVVNRAFQPVEFSQKNVNGKHILKTSAMTICISDDMKPLSADTLSVTFEMNGTPVEWHPGQAADGNLGSTLRTLDGIQGGRCMIEKAVEGVNHPHTLYRLSDIDLGKGFISRDGWSLIDDSKNIVIDQLDGKKWVTPRVEGECQDWYLLAYGHDYTDALADAAGVFGSQPLAPRNTLGYWWSRYWAYNDTEIEELVRSFDRMSVPIDVMVIDMDWHLEGWTGYTWDRRYFPDPDEHLRWLHEHEMKVTLNLHPADGVAKFEDQFEDMCKAMDLNPEEVDKVEFNITDPKYMDNYFKILHHPEERRGVDFWWMDWQQGESTAMPGLDTLPWINQLHWEDMEGREDRGGKRPLIFSRFGGYGAGRYNVGFSGDTYSTWESLAFQPYFTATASNVLYGYWSHDIGGHMPGPIEPELFTRWIQYGVYSPILRTHTSKEPRAERRVWEYPAPFSDIMMDTIRQRYRMVPYIYSENRKAYDTGISLCRPMYYSWPELDEAYEYKDQYMYGDSMLVMPVTKPCDTEDEMAEIKVWLPEGEWFDTARGCRETGGQVITRKYMINEVPVFVSEGAVIPGQNNVSRLEDKCYKNLSVSVYPGDSGSYELYEDDGSSMEYLNDQFAVIEMSHSTSKNVKTIKIGRKSGGFAGYEAVRSLEVRLEGSVPPAAVKVAGRNLEYSYRTEKQKECWSYEGRNVAAVIKISEFNLDDGTEITVEYPDSVDKNAADKLRGCFNRLLRVNDIAVQLTSFRVLHPQERLAQEAAHAAVRMSMWPEQFSCELKKLKIDLQNLPEAILELASTSLGDRYDLNVPPRLENGKKAISILNDITLD